MNFGSPLARQDHSSTMLFSSTYMLESLFYVEQKGKCQWSALVHKISGQA